MTIHVYSLDFDGCILHETCHQILHSSLIDSEKARDTIIISCNETLISEIKAKMQELDCEQSIIFVGSNRQSYMIDQLKTVETGLSCFSIMKALSKHLNATFDPLLLADIYGNLLSGTSFEQAIIQDTTTESIKHAESVFDHTKATLLYAQMHKIASEHLNTDIEFNFYDDRLDIHQALIDFYLEAAYLIPNQVILKFHHYNGDLPSIVCSLNGTGPVDENYRRSIKEMHKQVQKNTGCARNNADIAKNLKLQEFLDWQETELAKSMSLFSSPMYEQVTLKLQHMSHRTYIAALKLLGEALEPEYKERSVVRYYIELAQNTRAEFYDNFAPVYLEILHQLHNEYQLIHATSEQEYHQWRQTIEPCRIAIQKRMNKMIVSFSPEMATKLQQRKGPIFDDFSLQSIDYQTYKLVLKVIDIQLQHDFIFKFQQKKDMIVKCMNDYINQAQWLDEHLDFTKILPLIIKELNCQFEADENNTAEQQALQHKEILDCRKQINELMNSFIHSPERELIQDTVIRVPSSSLRELNLFQSETNDMTQQHNSLDTGEDSSFIDPGLTLNSEDFY